MKLKTLIIDDENLFGESLQQELNESKLFSAYYTSSPKEALKLTEAQFDLILLDLRLNGQSGLNHIEDLKGKWPGSKLYIMTGYGTIASAVEAMKNGAQDYLTKPITLEKVKNLIIDKNPHHQEDNAAIMSLDRVEREYIEHVLAQEKGNISKTAEKLGLHRQSLQRKLKKWVPNK